MCIRDRLNSESAILAALAIGGLDVRSADDIIKQIVQNPKLWERLEESRNNFEEQQIDGTVTEIVNRFQRTGPTPEAVRELETLFDGCWKKEQWPSVVKVGDLLLSSTYNRFEYVDLVKSVADRVYQLSLIHI